jgi:hypothetical protein
MMRNLSPTTPKSDMNKTNAKRSRETLELQHILTTLCCFSAEMSYSFRIIMLTDTEMVPTRRLNTIIMLWSC